MLSDKAAIKLQVLTNFMFRTSRESRPGRALPRDNIKGECPKQRAELRIGGRTE